MKRAERQHALLDILRASAPRPRSVTRLAAELEVSTRTIERDIAALQVAGVPIYAEPGRRGGYAVTKEYSLPPLTFTEDEAAAIITGLSAALTSPFEEAAKTAARKVLAAMPDQMRDYAVTLSGGVHVFDDGAASREVADTVRLALRRRVVVHIEYVDSGGNRTARDVEPLALLAVRGGWVLSAWCRLREAMRGFRVDWIESCALTDEPVPDRDPAVMQHDLERWGWRQLP